MGDLPALLKMEIDMKINHWSVVQTADDLGVALLPEGCSTEICVRVEGDKIVIRAYDESNCVAELRVYAGEQQ